MVDHTTPLDVAIAGRSMGGGAADGFALAEALDGTGRIDAAVAE